MYLRTTPACGFTMIEIMIVTVLIALLAAIAIPNIVHARSISQRNTCISNLRQIDTAAQNWAMDYKKLSTDSYTLEDVKPYLNRNAGEIPTCPSSGTYTTGLTISERPTCTIDGHVLP